MPETSLKETMAAYFDNEVKIDIQKEIISNIGKSAGVAETFLKENAKSPLSVKDAQLLEQLFPYSKQQAEMEPMLLERDRLARKINYSLQRIPNKKVLFTRKVVHIHPASSKEVLVAVWSDGVKLFVENFTG